MGRGGGVQGLELKAVSASLLAAHFAKVGLKLQGPVPIAFLHRPLHVYLSLLNILETVELWLDAQPAARKRKPLVAPPAPVSSRSRWATPLLQVAQPLPSYCRRPPPCYQPL